MSSSAKSLSANPRKRQGRSCCLVTAFAVAGGATLIASPAENASLMLTLSEQGFAPVTVTDTGNTGTVSYFGSYGGFSTNVVIGVSNQFSAPTPTAAQIQVQSVEVTSTTAGTTPQTLAVTVSDSGFTFPATGPYARSTTTAAA